MDNIMQKMVFKHIIKITIIFKEIQIYNAMSMITLII